MKRLRLIIEKFLADRLRSVADRLSPPDRLPPYEIMFEPSLIEPGNVLEFVEVEIEGKSRRVGRWVRNGKYHVLKLPR